MRRANAGLMFDQFKQDQTVGITYSESNGRRSAGLMVWDRADTGLGALVDALNAANKLTGAERDKALAAARAAAPPGPRRVFVGKTGDKAAIVSLADGDGKPRLNITVDAAENPRIEFLDADGKVIAKLPQIDGTFPPQDTPARFPVIALSRSRSLSQISDPGINSRLMRCARLRGPRMNNGGTDHDILRYTA